MTSSSYDLSVVERLAAIETALTTQGRAIDKLADALINREVFNELQGDVHTQEECIHRMELDLNTLKNNARIAGIVVTALFTALISWALGLI